MHDPCAEILRVWETGRDEAPAGRALALLTLVCPDKTRDELASLPLGRRDELLLTARRRTLGDSLRAVADCPACGETVEINVPGKDLVRVSEHHRDEHVLDADGYELRLRLLNSHDLLAVEACESADAARAVLVERCVSAAFFAGEPVPVEALSEAAVEALEQRILACDPQVETVFELSCPDCEDSWSCELDVASFFWKELNDEALRLLDEVHVLAQAYGWSERETLALSPARRQWYLGRVM